MNNIAAIIMAAGKGTRMRSSIPKVLHQVAGATIVSHVLRAVRHVGADGVWVVVPSAPGRQGISSALGEGVDYVEQQEPLGTGHALGTALPHLPGNVRQVLVTNGDTPLVRGETFRALVDKHAQARAVLTLLIAPMEPAKAHDLGWLERDSQGRPARILEAREPASGHRKSEGAVEANVGVYCIEAGWLGSAIGRLPRHASGEAYVTDLVSLAREDGLVVETMCVGSDAEAIGVNSRAQLAQAESAMQERLRTHWMDQGVTLEDPATTYFHLDVEMGQEAVVRPNTRLLGRTSVGRGAEIGPNAQLTDVTIGDECKVGSSILDGVVLEPEVMVGPYCHLRPGTHLDRGVFVGSHVEIKNSRIGAGTHIGHFAYVGDAIIGRNVNVGAGTVTCNFDGVAKHVTEIGEGALIGSDTLLVAPVKIGARAATGAGTVVTQDVPEGVTVVGAPARLLDRRRRITSRVSGRGEK